MDPAHLGPPRNRPAATPAPGNGMSRADDHTLRSYRPNDPYQPAEPSRPGEQPGGGDPLAELARLIGQRDPFAEFGRSNSRQGSRPPPDVPTTARDGWQQACTPETDL